MCGSGWRMHRSAPQMGNVAWVEDAVRLVRAAGGEPATAAEVRAALAGSI